MTRIRSSRGPDSRDYCHVQFSQPAEYCPGRTAAGGLILWCCNATEEPGIMSVESFSAFLESLHIIREVGQLLEPRHVVDP